MIDITVLIWLLIISNARVISINLWEWADRSLKRRRTCYMADDINPDSGYATIMQKDGR